mmetsp:Transcript_109642/g.171464  ORF Transcript_109642/g.171464 Transcript_109642/m.171464 type:complete len:88 (-) Transcript_109642:13-276(-)
MAKVLLSVMEVGLRMENVRTNAALASFIRCSLKRCFQLHGKAPMRRFYELWHDTTRRQKVNSYPTANVTSSALDVSCSGRDNVRLCS